MELHIRDMSGGYKIVCSNGQVIGILDEKDRFISRDNMTDYHRHLAAQHHADTFCERLKEHGG